VRTRNTLSIKDFSIIIPTFNRGYCIDDAIASVMNQLHSDFEILVIDDGSTDDTRERVLKYNPSFVRHISIDHQGASMARNKGLTLANGKIICFLDCDDIFLPGYFETVINTEADFGCVGAHWSREWIDDSGRIIDSHQVETPNQASPEDIISWRVKVPIGTGLFLKRELLDHKPSFSLDLKILEELDFFIQLYHISQNFTYLPDKLFRYRQVFGGDGVCSMTNYQDLAYAFGRIYELYAHDKLINSLIEHFPTKAARYKHLHEMEERGEFYPHKFKYFPNLWSGLAS
jgi:glycosyltransferase involved in cell wall biosynthesis